MSRYDKTPFRFDGLGTIPLAERGGKVRVEDFARAYQPGSGIIGWLDALPRILMGDDLRALVNLLREARGKGKPILWGMGGHVIKCGLAPVLIDLMRRGYATGFLMNGSTSIHDFEIALCGATSEDVESVLPGGRFGMAKETGEQWNAAAVCAAGRGCGLGEALGERAQGSPHAEASLLAQAWASRVPVTVHLAIGTDTPHMHPQAGGAALGAATHHDFRLACTLVSELGGGGAYLNVGSAVVLPEVFLKCVSVVRNLGTPLLDFTTANFDFIQHYRPRVNVVQRPHAQAGGRGFAFTGHHELMIPLLAAALVEGER